MSYDQAAPTLRDLGLPPTLSMPGPLPGASGEAVLAHLGNVAARLRRAAAADDLMAGAALALAGEGFEARLPSLAGRLVAGGQGGGRGIDPAALGYALYREAEEALGAGEVRQAAAALALLLPSATLRLDGLVGLAVCAGRLARGDVALELALEALAHQPGHPRACLVAGLSYLERGQKRAAQTYLAAASRSARKRAEFRDDLRAAQRALLLLHLA